MRAPRFTTQQLLTAALTIRCALSALMRLLASNMGRKILGWASLCVGLAVQVGLCLTTMYLIDLAISLFELWADLARKHLELTV